jgi:hypothetical protein
MTIPAGFAQVNWFFVGSAMPNGAQVTLGLDVNPLLTPSDVALVAHNAVADNVMPIASQEVVLIQTLAKFGPDATGPSATAGTTVAGGASASTVSPNVAILVKKVTNLGGRKNRGRFYWPGGVDTQITQAGALDSTAVVNWANAMDALYADLVTGDCQPVLLHGDATSPTTIEDFIVDGTVATQRRRLRR